mgnify:CR=1 FL=1
MAFFRRTRYIADIFWQFRYYLLCTGLALAFWDTSLIKPFRFFVVLVHEINHATAAILTGGEVVEIRTHWDESGHTLAQGGIYPIISAAGYVGSALLGALLIYTGLYPQLQRFVLLGIGAVCMGMTMLYTPLGGLDFGLGIGGGLGLCTMAIKSQRMARIGSVWMGVMLSLYSLHDFRTDLWSQTELTDAGLLSDYWGLDPMQTPYLAYLIALSWVLLSLACMYRAMRALVRKKKA